MRLKLVDTFFEQGLKLLAEMVRQPNLSEKAYNEAKKQVMILSENDTMSTPRVADRIFYDNLFKNNPGFGWLSGKKEQMEKIQLEDVKAFYSKFYNPSNLILAVSGNISIEKALAMVKQSFGGVWGDAGWQPPAFTPEFKTLGTTVREKMGKQQSYISVANTCDVSEEDQPALYVMETIFSDRLAFNLREKQGLAYTIGVSFHKYRGVQWYRISMGTRPENIEQAIKGIRDEIISMREARIEEKEVQKTINAILGRRGMRRLDRVNQAYYISMKALDDKVPESDDEEVEKLKKVTVKDMERLARQVFKSDDHLIVIVE